MTHTWTESEIAAFMAGRLHGADAERIAAALERDADAQAAAERMGEADALDDVLRAAFAAAPGEEPPAALRAALLADPGKVAVLPRRPRSGRIPAALAAGLALAAGFGAGWGLRSPDAPAAPAAIAVGPATGGARLALDVARSGVAQGGIAPTATFRDGAGRICREFDALDVGGAPQAAGVACREGADWRILLLAEHPEAPGTDDGFAPAGAAAADPIGAFLDRLDAGPALSPDEEAALISRAWR